MGAALMATFDATPGVPSLVEPDDQDRAGAYASLNQLAQYFAPLNQPPPTYVDFFTQLAATGVPPIGYQQSKANALNYAGVPVTGPTTALSNQLLLVDASAASVPITLPAAPTVNDLVAVVVSALTAPNVVTVAANGNAFNIAGGPQTLTLPLLGEIAQFQYVGAGIWVAAVMANPGAVEPAGTAATLTAALQTALEAEIQQVASQISPSLARQVQVRIAGTLALGQVAGGLDIEQGFTAMGVRVVADDIPTGAAATINAVVNGTTIYTATLSAGQSTSLDTSPNSGNGVVFPSGSYVTFTVTQTGSTKPGGNVTIVFSDAIGGNPPPTIGSVTSLAVSALAGGFSATWDYAAVDANDDLGHYAVRYLAGTTAPTNPNQGTAAPDVSGSVQNPAITVTGLTPMQTYSVSVFPIGADGTVGTLANHTVTTLATDTTPPPSGTISDGGHSSSTVTVTITPSQTTAGQDIVGGYLRRGNATTTSPADVTKGHPALTGNVTDTGAGTWVACTQAGKSVTDTGLAPSTNYAYSWFPQDASQNMQPTPATFHVFTSAAATSGQGAYGLVPSTWAHPFTESFTGRTSAWIQGSTNTQWWVANGWQHQTQGPSRREHFTVIGEPGNTSNSIVRIVGDLVTAGWYNSGYGNFNLAWADNTTAGTGWYGGRGGISGQTQLYGGFEVRVRTTSPATGKFGNNWKGGNVQGWPVAHWPQDELDVREQFSPGAMTCNMHYWDPLKTAAQQTAGTQLTGSWSVTDGNWQVFTFLWYPPGYFGTGTPSRQMVYMDNVLRFDTGLPGTTNPTPSTLTATKIGYLLNGPMSGSGSTISEQSWDLGFALAYTGYGNGATFTAANGTGTTQRQTQYFDIDSVDIWSA